MEILSKEELSQRSLEWLKNNYTPYKLNAFIYGEPNNDTNFDEDAADEKRWEAKC